MMIRLQKYDATMNYTPGKYMFAADTLSRAVDKNERTDEGLCGHGSVIPACF